MEKFAVFGNPIEHSLSPKIHSIFSFETNIIYSYGKVFSPIEDFEIKIKKFFNTGGLGANITSPFKERAFFICDTLTNRASLSGVVNTIKKQTNGTLLGDNTDGIGLVDDLKKLNLIKKNSNILLIGAGGASRGVIPSILLNRCNLTLTNRTFSKAKKLAKIYSHLGKIITLETENLIGGGSFDLIINATSAEFKGEVPIVSKSLITPNVSCYDMMYKKDKTKFINWCQKQGSEKIYDGIGMLVRQAAHSFLLWHGTLPFCVEKVIKILKK